MSGKQRLWWNVPVVGLLTLLAFGCALPAQVTPASPAQSRDSQATGDASQRVARATEAPRAAVTAPTVVPTAVVKPTVAATPGGSGVRTVSVRRGSITETTQLTGRVAGSQEVPLSFASRTTVLKVPVAPGEAVSEGQILVEADVKQISAALAETRVRVENAAIQVEAGQKQAKARRQSATADAEDAVNRATADLDRLEGGPAESDRLVIEAGVVTARATLERAQADLAKVRAGASEAERRTAAQDVAANRLALKTAETDRTQLKAGADPAALRVAENDLTRAKGAVAAAQGELDQISKPDPYDLRAAEREVDRANAVLKAANAATPSSAVAIADARLALLTAQDRLTRLQEPPRADILIQARGKLDIAKSELAGAQERLTKLQKGPDQLALDKADAAVEAARTALAKSETQLADLQAGPSSTQILAAERVVEGARIGLSTAEARLTELTNRPAELEAARQRLATAQERARSVRDAVDSSSADLALLQKGIERDKAQLKTLEADMEAGRLRAPFKGTVVAVPAQPGDSVDAGRPAVVVAREGEPVVAATIASADDRVPPRVSVGQTARVQVDAGDGAPLEGTVARLADAVTGSGRQAQIKVAWGVTLPPYGATAQVDVKLQDKKDVLLVPMSAVRSAGPRKYVEYMDGATRQITEVEVGITTAADAEILSGLQEGQVVIATAGPAPSGGIPSSPPLATTR